MQRKDNRGNEGRSARRKSPSNASFKRILRSPKLHRGLGGHDHSLNDIFRFNLRNARSIWGERCASTMSSLKELSYAYGLSVAAGDLQLLNGKWYVTHAGLLVIANRSGCSAITTAIDHSASEPSISRWVFKATVYKGLRSKGFVGLRRCRSVQHVSPGPRRRNACRRNASRQSRSPKSLRNRALQCRRARFVLGSAKARSRPRRIQMVIPDRTAQATASRDCVTSCAC